ncbi:methyltransferase [Pseudoalteromonas peptidolytica]|uniref:Methyltransferase small domain-containing protein n=1 Tax=Pseudoalteromonas peptidolytica F12-50-A1 TaxID=1315280 RepID=A0A8I0MY73_9GAMM|nr:methyltransferase [Pseudoalteromonas peptidolytica]MBE0348232.1 hypothetical protein [Pseudoalteromonas peptidolytica F12-50-A1]NLR16594.1 methyltransferase [Pseudoalteromonas peptidolytica]GEK11883.1 lambda phage type II DNA modification methyltransferase [Pseudoalteromonas peptidolytica]
MIKSDVIESISLMKPQGNRLELPSDIKFENYAQVKNALIKAGGKYKRCGFEFTSDAAEMQQRLTSGEVVNDAKKYQYFPTPTPLAKRMVEMANIRASDYCLEPSAGQGSIAAIIRKKSEKLTCIELSHENVKVLKSLGIESLHDDFLKFNCDQRFDKIVANPPFAKNQDIDHVRHMYSLLNDGGRIVTVMSKSWVFGNQKKQVNFRQWLNSTGAKIEELGSGEFKESGTNVSSMLVTIDKTA